MEFLMPLLFLVFVLVAPILFAAFWRRHAAFGILLIVLTLVILGWGEGGR